MPRQPGKLKQAEMKISEQEETIENLTTMLFATKIDSLKWERSCAEAKLNDVTNRLKNAQVRLSERLGAKENEAKQ